MEKDNLFIDINKKQKNRFPCFESKNRPLVLNEP